MIELDAHDGVVAASWAMGDDLALPLVVCIPGGGYNRHYFDIPGVSLLDRGRLNGFGVLALDRPGYGDSAQPSIDEGWFPHQARVVNDAIADAWERLGAGRPGIVVIGHSFGATVALRVAALNNSWPLLGVSVNGTTESTVSSMLDFASSLEGVLPLTPIALEPQQIESFFYGPEGTFDPAVLRSAEKAVSPAPALEIREWATQWPVDAPGVLARIEVPVQVRLSEYDAVQDVSQQSLNRFTSLLSSAPFIDAAIVSASGHNADHHAVAPVLHLSQLAFAAGCAA